MRVYPYITAVALAVLATQAFSQIYKWKDAAGVMHYSDTPPPSGSAQVVKTKDTPVSAVPSGGNKSVTASAAKASTPPSAASKAASSAQAQPEKNPKACQDARRRKSLLESGGRIQVVNEKGEVEFISQEQRTSEINQADKAIQQNCD